MFLKVTNLSMTYDKKVLYDNASFSVNHREKIGIVGANGTGKTTLINILNGDTIPDSGTIEFDKKIKVGFLDQYLRIDKQLTILEYLNKAFDELNAVEARIKELQKLIEETTNYDEIERYANSISYLQERLELGDFYANESKIMRIASGLGITKYGMDTLMSKLSGGQKIKIILAKLLLEQPNLLVLDEPTNFLDTAHVDWLVKYLKEYKGTVLMVSHNQEFLNEVATSILDIEFGKITKYRKAVRKKSAIIQEFIIRN